MTRRRVRAALVSLVVLAGCSAREREVPADSNAAAERGGEPVAKVEIPALPEPAVSPAIARKQACLRDHVEPARARDQTLVRSLCAEWIEGDVPGVELAIA